MIHYNRFFLPSLLSVFFLLLFYGRVNSQESNTMYYMDRLPQSNLLNPALQPNYNFSYGLPASSDFYFRYDNNSTAIEDFLIKQPGSDTFVTPFHSSLDPYDFLDKLESSNHFLIETQTNIFSLGFRIKSLYFSINARENYFVKFAYPRDLMSFAMLGTEEFLSSPADFSGFDFDVSNYREIGFGISKSFMQDKFFIGVRAKLLFGLMNFNSETTDISLEMTAQRWAFYNNIVFNSSGPITIDDTEDNFFQAMDFDFDDPLDYFLNMKNTGTAIDIGAVYNITDKLSVSASAIDIGSINWKEDVYQFNINSADTITFEGINLDAGTDVFEALQDSLGDAFDFNYTSNSFKTTLASKYYVGANYKLTERINFGVLSKTHIYRNETLQSFTLSANLTPVNFLSLTGTYTVMTDRPTNFGAGVVFKFGPSQWYLVSDNLSQMFYPLEAQTISFRWGLNIVFGDKKKREKKKKEAEDKDNPLLETEEILIEE